MIKKQVLLILNKILFITGMNSCRHFTRYSGEFEDFVMALFISYFNIPVICRGISFRCVSDMILTLFKLRIFCSLERANSPHSVPREDVEHLYYRSRKLMCGMLIRSRISPVIILPLICHLYDTFDSIIIHM